MARGLISTLGVTFSDEASWGSSEMQKSQALCWVVVTVGLVLRIHSGQVRVLCDCTGDEMRWEFVSGLGAVAVA